MDNYSIGELGSFFNNLHTNKGNMKITFVGNFNVSYSSETHHAKTLEAMGHMVYKLQENGVQGDTILDHALRSDLLLVVHTHGWKTPGKSLHEALRLLKGRIPIITYHLDLWLGLQREKDLRDDPFYMLLDHFFCTDKLMADWLNKETSVKGHYLPAGVLEDEAISYKSNEKTRNIIFVGSKGYHTEWKWRPTLINWLQESYGDKFLHYGNDGLRVVRGLELNALYATSKIAVGDTLCLNFNYPYYFSDRLFESIGRGAFTLFPYIKGLEDNFILGEELVTFQFGDFIDLRNKIDYFLKHDEEREGIRQKGFNRVLKDHTYTSRWKEILRIINENTN